MRGFGFGVLGAVAVLVFSFAASGVHAQSATTAQVGKPLALLAGLRPPHETKRHETRHLARAKAGHEKAAGRARRVRMAAHGRHAAAKKLVPRDHTHRERALTASAFAEEPPPPQVAANPQPASAPQWPAVTAAPANESPQPAAAPVAANAATTNESSSADAAGVSPDPDASPVQTLKITAANPTSLTNPAADSTSAAANADDNAVPAPMPAAASQTVLAAPVHEASKTTTVGSASWFAQLLAALGGAIAAGAVAWFLIGGGPVRTYG